jgi:hypothetical protein
MPDQQRAELLANDALLASAVVANCAVHSYYREDD